MKLPSRLIVVSNREPYIQERSKAGRIISRKAVGGLVSVLDRVVASCNGLWIAWGSGSADFIYGETAEVPPGNPKYKLKRIRLSEREVSRYYRGFSNGTIWPLFHLFPERARFIEGDWKYYQKVNLKFATAIVKEAQAGDMVWVHDYHLALVPKFIRELNKDTKIAFFWHIPWVNWDVFNKLPWRAEIFEGLLGSDLIGFHTKSYVEKFMECAEQLGFSINRKKGIIKYSRGVSVKAFPIGMDYNIFQKVSDRDAIKLKKKMRAEKLILGVDRLDYTKGIVDRLLAFERFLQKYPKFRGKAVLLQIATPSRTKVEEYRKIKKEIDETVGRINGLFQRMDWIPIRYFYRTFPQTQLAVFYRASDVALITPWMDGMNLISKEYIAANEDGVLILSEFAGAAEELKEAIIVNPHDIEGVADAIKDALEMSSEERKERFKVLSEKVRKTNINWWLNKFLKEWNKTYETSA